MKKIIYLFLFLVFFVTGISYGQHGYNEEIYKARVLEIIDTYENPATILYDQATVQSLAVKILDKDKRGEIFYFDNDYIQLKKNQKFFLGIQSTEEGEVARVVEQDRTFMMISLLLLFFSLIILFGKKKGLRSVLSLLGSVLIISYVLIPSILKGVSPILVSIIVATLILSVAIFFTHGFRRESFAAFLGTIISVIITIILATLSVSWMGFNGLGTEEAWYLKDMTEGINFSGLLLGGIILGVLGVLDDIAVTQVSVVRELYRTDPLIRKKVLYKRAINVGQEHVGALVNTLALAYAGAGLPLLMLFTISPYPSYVLLNQEIFSAEFVRTIVGSMGLVLTVPISTAIAVYMLEKYRGQKGDHFGHNH